MIEYAEAMSTTPMGVTDEMVAGLLENLSEAAVVELTAAVALENFYSRSNSALGFTSQGFKETVRPAARAWLSPPTSRGFARPGVRGPATAAGRCRIPGARECRRRGGRGAGDLAALGGGRPERGARPAGLPAAVATRQALNRVRQQQNRREDYVGPWLPEPVSTDRGPAESVELADSVSMAMLVVLETLSPLERAAFVLHDVFGLSFAEVATTLDRSEAAVRQLANRARGHVHSRRPEVVDRKRHDAVLDQFIQHLTTGDMDSFMALLAPDIVLVTDGGGIKRAALRPIHGPEKVVRWLVGVLNRPDYTGETRVEVTRLNDETAILLYADDELDTVAFCTVEDRGITALYFVRNPVKLGRVTGRRPRWSTDRQRRSWTPSSVSSSGSMTSGLSTRWRNDLVATPAAGRR